MTLRRRVALACAAALTALPPGLAEARGKIRRIGWLGNVPPSTPEAAAVWDAFHLELQRLGWVEGRDIAFERRFSEGVVERLPQLAHDLIERNLDVIVATGSGALAAKEATSTIPIVFAAVPDPVGAGLVASLARPGGNLTGLSSQGWELIEKRLQLLKETMPAIQRIAYLSGESGPNPELRDAATVLGVELMVVQARRAEDLAAAFAEGKRANGWCVNDRAMHFAQRRRSSTLSRRSANPRFTRTPCSSRLEA